MQLGKFIWGLGFAIVFASSAWAQSPGEIVDPATGPGGAVLDPNGDGWVSASGAAFVSDDQAESEIPFVAIPSVQNEPTGDVNPSGGTTDLVDTGNFQSSFVYFSDPDGTPGNADDDQRDQDGDGLGDACDDDADGNGIWDVYSSTGAGCQQTNGVWWFACVLLWSEWRRRKVVR